MKPTMLRRGKSTAFIGVDLFGDNGLAVRALLCFGSNRPSSIGSINLPAPAVKSWNECPAFFVGDYRPASTAHFDGRLAAGARPRTPGCDPAMVVWLQHADRNADATMAGLVALADALPPAATILFPQKPVPISTMTWALDILTDSPESASGWWLVSIGAQATTQGYSAQDMAMWNDQGEPVMAMRQAVAIFA
jgi:Thioesterase-like superfamily